MNTRARDSFLTGIKVLEIGDGIAGSTAAALLASLGAEVAKASHHDTPSRVGPIISTKTGPVAAVDLTLDQSKRILGPPTDADALASNDDMYDIVIVDRGTVVRPPEAHNAVVVVVSPFGLDGPRCAESGGELVAQAAGGMLATIEGSDGTPVPAPGYVASKAAGAVTALAALHGLDQRNSTKGSVLVDVSVQEAVVFTAALPECAHVLYSCPGRAGSGRYLAPSGLFECRDGLVRITAVENHQWKGLLGALNHPAWAAGLDERSARIEHAGLINQHVAAWAATQAKEGCAALLQAHGVPSTPVNTPEEILTSPQFAFRAAVSATRLGDVPLSVLEAPWLTQIGRPGVDDRTSRLSDVRIVELTHVLAGPIVGALLGAMGAPVVRLEDPDRLDIYRRTGPFAHGKPGIERGAYFAVSNHSKQSRLIEPSRATQDVAAALKDADVLIENVGTSRLTRLDVNPAALADSGKLVMRVSGFGSTGPMAGYRVYANNVQAYGGLAGLTLGADGTPAKLGTVIADPLSSVVAATVIAAWALGPGRNTGAVIDLSMAEVVASTVAEFVSAASAAEQSVVDNATAPHRGIYRAMDGRWVAVELSGSEDQTHAADHVAMQSYLTSVIAIMSAGEASARLATEGIRAVPVLRAEDLVADPHLAARGFFPEIAHPDLEIGTARLVGLPWRFVGRGPVPLAPPPALGSTNLHQERMTSAR